MLKISDFLGYVRNFEIPPSAPIVPDWMERQRGDMMDVYTARSECTKLGMWAIVDLDWTKRLAAWIDGLKVLEVMAGKGWLAKALSLHGVDIVATDNMGWTNMHADPTYLYPVEKLGARAAVTKYQDANILLVSWPPYGDIEVMKVCKAWGTNRPIIYIGEGEGGCNAPDGFFRRFREEEIDIPLPQWDGIHDYVRIGYYRP